MATVRPVPEAGLQLISCDSSVKASIRYKSLLSGYKIPQIALPVLISNRTVTASARSASNSDSQSITYDDLKAGSPVVIVEPPPYLKTAEPMPMMRANSGLVMPGDAGRVIGRKAKGVWAVRVASGAFLIDQKYFKPLNVQ